MTATLDRRRALRAGLTVAAALIALWPLMSDNRVTVSLYTLAAIWALWAWSLNIVWGFAGQFSMAQLALGAVAGYTFAILLVEYDWPTSLGVVAGILAAVAVSAVIGLVALKLTGFRFAIMTLAFALGILGVINNAEITGRTSGMGVPSSLPELTVGGWTWDLAAPGPGFYLLVVLALVGVTAGIAAVLRTRTGRAMLALREDELLGTSLGVDPRRYRIVAFVLSAVVSGLAGTFHAMSYNFISPDAFSFTPLVNTILILVIGGRGTLWGPALGAGVYVLFSESLRLGGEFETALFGVIVIAITVLAPRGIAHYLKLGFDRLAGPAPTPSPVVSSAPAVPSVPSAEPLPGPEPSQTSADGAEPLLRVVGLDKRFGGVVATNDVTFDVGRGQIVGIVGPNGAGKTTLFNLVSGFMHPDSGEVVWQGRPITGLRPSARVALGLTRTFQHSRVFPQLSVRTNLEIATHGRRNFGSRAALVETVLADFGLLEVADSAASELSYGTVKRVSLALVVAAGSQLMMLDEPAAGLAEADIDVLRHDLLRLRDSGVTVLVVEHHMSLIMRVCDRVVVLDAGTMIADGPPDQVSRDPAVVEAYLGVGV